MEKLKIFFVIITIFLSSYSVHAANDIFMASINTDQLINMSGNDGYAPNYKYPTGDAPYQFDLDAENNVWISLAGTANSIQLLNASTNYSIEKTVPVGSSPKSVIIDVDGNVWVTLQDDDKLLRYNVTDGVKTNFSTCDYPWSMDQDSQSNILVACHNTGDASVFFFNRSDGYNSKKYDNGQRPVDVYVDKFDNFWVSYYYANIVGFYNASNNYAYTSYPVPGALAITGDYYGNIFVEEIAAGKLKIFNYSDGYSTKEIDGYTGIRSLVCDNDTQNIYGLTEGSSSILAIFNASNNYAKSSVANGGNMGFNSLEVVYPIKETVINAIPTISSITASVDPIAHNATQNISGVTIADGDGDTLYFYCSNTTNEPTAGNTICTGGTTSDASSPYNLDCTFPAGTNRTPTIWCRVYDGTDYSTAVSTTYESYVVGNFNFNDDLSFCNVTSNTPTSCWINLTDYTSIDYAYMDVTGISAGGSYPSSPNISIGSEEVWSPSSVSDISSSTESVFNEGVSNYNSIVELSDGRLAVAYRDGGNNDYGTFAICNSNGSSCSKNVFHTHTTDYISMTELSDGRLAAAFKGDGNEGYFAICNSSGQNCTNPLFDGTYSSYMSLVELSDGRLAVAYRDDGNGGNGTFVICNSSGEACSNSTFNAGMTAYISMTELSDGRLAVAYKDEGGSSYGRFAICNSSGEACVETIFNSATTTFISMAKLSNDSLAVVYHDDGSSSYGTLAICNSSGEACAESFFNEATTYHMSLVELSDGRLAVAYRDDGNSSYGTFAICNSNGEDCTYKVFNEARSDYISMTELSDGRLAVAYNDDGNSDYGTFAITNSLKEYSSTETTGDFSSSLSVGSVNYFNITATTWGKLFLDNLNISANQAPTIASITASVDPIAHNATQNISGVTIADGDGDTLYFYCSNTTTEPTAGNTICTGGTTSDASSPYNLDCTFPAGSNKYVDVWCRVYDGTDYSTVVQTNYTSWTYGSFNFSDGLGYCNVTGNDSTTCAIDLTSYSSIDYAYMDVTGLNDSGATYPSSPNISIGSEEVWSNSGDYAIDPIPVGTYNDSDGDYSLDGAGHIFVSGDYAYTTSVVDSTLAVWNISAHGNPVPVGTYTSISGNDSLHSVQQIYVSGDYAYTVSVSDDTFVVWNISAHGNPVPIGTYTSDSGNDTLDGAYSIFVSGDYAYTGSYNDDTLVVWDISAHSDPVPVGSYTNDGWGDYSINTLWDIFVSGDYAYTCTASSHVFDVFDISAHGNPVPVGTYGPVTTGAYSIERARSVFVSGDYAYIVSQEDDNLVVFNISAHGNPVPIGNYSSSEGEYSLDGVYDVFVSGDYAYTVSNVDDTLVVFDISAHSNPVPVASYTDSDGDYSLAGAFSVFVSGDYAYTGSYDNDTFAVFQIVNNQFSSTETTTDFSSSLSTGSINYFNITASSWSKLFLDNLNISANQAPTISSITASTDPVGHNATQNISGVTIADGDGDTLYFYCSNTTNEPTAGNTICTGGTTSDASSPYNLDCTFPGGTNRTPTIWCRVYDGTDYSTAVSTTYESYVVGNFYYNDIESYCSVTSNDSTSCWINLTDYTSIDHAYMDVSGISAASYDLTTGTSLEFDSVYGLYNSLVQINDSHYLNVYTGEDLDGYAVVLTVDGTTITNGTALEFDSDNGEYNSMVQIDSTHYLNVYDGEGSDGYAVVLTVDGTTITNGTKYEFDTVRGQHNSLVQIDSTHYINTYRNGTGVAVVLTVNQTDWTITAGSKLEFDSNDGQNNDLIKINDTHYLNLYTGLGLDGYAVVLEVDGTTITNGTPFEFETENSGAFSISQINETHYLATYQGLDSDGYAVVLIIDNMAITKGTAIEFDSNDGKMNSLVQIDATHYLNTYQGLDGDGYAVVLTVDGTTITSGTPFEFDTTYDSYNSLVQIDATHYLNAYSGTDSDGYAVVLEVDTLSGYPVSPKIEIDGSEVWSYSGTIIDSSWCYQEDPKVSNQKGNDGSCDLVYTGDYLTGGDNSIYRGYILINYTIPSGALNSSKWLMKNGNRSFYNISLSNCSFSGGTLQLGVNGTSPGYTSQPMCYDGVKWINIGEDGGDAGVGFNSNADVSYLNRSFDGEGASGSYVDGGLPTSLYYYTEIGEGWLNKIALYEEAIYWDIPTFNYTFQSTETTGDFKGNLTLGAINYFNITGTTWGKLWLDNLNISANIDTCTCPGTGTWNIKASDHCNITTDCDMGGGNINISGEGSFNIDGAYITNFVNLIIEGLNSTNRLYVRAVNGGGFS